MTEKPISPLRQRMIEDMTVRNFVEKTRNDYVHHVRAFMAFLKRSPDTSTPDAPSSRWLTGPVHRREAIASREYPTG
jgi:hypothetical protein